MVAMGTAFSNHGYWTLDLRRVQLSRQWMTAIATLGFTGFLSKKCSDPLAQGGGAFAHASGSGDDCGHKRGMSDFRRRHS